jgi:hypothetical protein
VIARRVAFGAVACVLACSLAGCGEQPKVYKQGQYQGKEDAKPWNNSQFNGNQVEWEKAIKARNQGQDEYTRAVASAK